MDIDEIIDRRLKEFEILGRKGNVIFDFHPFLDMRVKASIPTELAFCISTANSSALAGLKFQKSLEGLNVFELEIESFEELMKDAGVRFYKRKAEYVFNALKRFEIIERALRMNSRDARRYLVKNVKGLGMKEASHFLRNLGRKDVAILDRHVIRWLKDRGYDLPKSYERIEEILRGIEKNLAKLDLFIWYEMTGKVLK